MRFEGEASDPAEGLVHRALVYGSDQEFIDVALPFVERGVAANEPTLVAVQERNAENLRAALSGAPPGVTLFPVEQWYETSARTRDKFGRWVAEHADGDGRVRLIGEPPWAIGHDAQVRDWARHESVLNVAFAEYPVTFVCPYDERVLPPEIIAHAHSTHPDILGAAGTSRSEDYEDPIDFCTRLDSSVSRPAGDPDQEVVFGLGDLPALRRTVGDLATAAGLSRSRADELVLAVNEIATNAVVHGRSPATARVWREDGELIFEVSDGGEGIVDVLAGQLTPSATSRGGRGLWLTRLVCDAVEIRNGSGCTVAIRASTPTFSLTA
jgi:anti-sigma regulatory factor (Ser/Thr protein kinase)